MSAPRLRLTRSHADDLAKVCDLGSDALLRIARALDQLGVTIKPSKIERAIAAEVGEDAARAVRRVLFGLATVRRRSHATVADLMDSVEQAFATDAGQEAKVQALHDCRPALERLLASTPIVVTAKAIDLSYDFAQVLLSTRILTDIRPVFDDAQKEIIGTAIVQTIRMESIASDGTQSNISIALDMEDIEQLRESCEIALRKATLTRKLIEENLHKETMMPGEDEDDAD